MPETEDYRKKLEEVLGEIKGLFERSEIRGTGIGSFIFAEKENRAIEVYHSPAGVIVEFWEDEEQRSEKEVDSFERSVKLIVDWAADT